MQRQIEFRTWDTENQEYSEWTNRDPFFSTSHGEIFFWERVQRDDGSYDGDIVLKDNEDRFILQQYTGLKDKGGIKIYEGDLCLFGDEKFSLKNAGIVIYEDGSFKIKYKSDPYPLKIDGKLSEKYLTVIGNCFQTI